MHCYVILSKCPKWATRKEPVKARQVSSASLTQQDSSAPVASLEIEEEEEAIVLVRPGGRKAAKAESAMAQAKVALAPKLVEIQEEFIRDNKRKVDLLEESKVLQEQSNDERIMAVDLDSISCPKRRRYYGVLQDRIMAKFDAVEEPLGDNSVDDDDISE